jgi:hypothetical protein
MTLEELQALVEELKDGNSKLSENNKLLNTQLNKERNKNKELNLEDFNKLTEKVEQLESENSKLNGTIKQKDIEVQKLSTSFQEANGKLEQLSYDDAITKVVDGLKLAGNKQAIAKKLLKAEATFKDGALSFGDKSVDDFVKDWTSPTGEGYMFLEGTQHSGGGASGGNNTNISVSGKLDGTKAEQEAYIKAKFNL